MCIDGDGGMAESCIQHDVGGFAPDAWQGFKRGAVIGYFTLMLIDQHLTCHDDIACLGLVQAYGLDASASPASPKASKPSGVPCSGKNLRVARFTERSVAWADRMTAISSWNVLAYSSSVVGLGLAACSSLNISVG